MSTSTLQEVRLEIVRSGNPHNQLLSPLTPYIALCGEGSPITFHIDFEHQQLLNRLEQLRYVTKQDQRVVAIPPRLREVQVGELGADIARVLRQIHTLSTELARAHCNCEPDQWARGNSIVHLRITLSGSELSLIPFEMAIAPLAYPGEGLELSLQASLPIVVTREIRHSGPAALSWIRPSSISPKVLVVYAEPDGMKVPAQAHVQAIRTAIDPWIRRLPEKKRTGNAEADAQEHLKLVKKRLQVLPNASLDAIYKRCAEEKFTHVHILAHGDTYEHAGNTRFGVALCKNDSTSKEVVSGKRLAKALQAEGSLGDGRSDPLVVTLATCDSGNQMTVLAPGGSIAHDLHVEGIPWVFASQFPLTVPGSVRMAEILYPRLFRGDDPRQIVFELRRQLFQSTQNDHDWASIVAYTTLPGDFTSQVAEFSNRQIKQAINVLLAHADSIIASVDAAKLKERLPEIRGIIDQVEDWLRTWRAREPKGNKEEDRLQRSEIGGMHGSTYKRIALLLSKIQTDDQDEAKEIKSYYDKSREHYLNTMAEAAATNMKYYWSATQYLSLLAVRQLSKDKTIYELAKGLAIRDINSNESNSTKAWAYATLAELDLLGTYHDTDVDKDQVIRNVEESCREIVELMGRKSFHVGSTYRQFQRYVKEWPNDLWSKIAQKASDILAPPENEEFEFPDDD